MESSRSAILSVMVDQLTDEISRATHRTVPSRECRAIADRLVVDFISRTTTDETSRTREALVEIRDAMFTPHQRTSTQGLPVNRGQVLDILTRHGL